MATYSSKPSLSGDYYLNSAGQGHKRSVLSSIQLAMDNMYSAVLELQKVEGMGTELLVERLQKEIEIFRGIKSVISKLSAACEFLRKRQG